MGDIGVPELLIILVIVVLLFGPSRVTGFGKALGQSIREFRNSVSGDESASKSAPDQVEQPVTTVAPAAAAITTPAATTTDSETT